MKEKMYSKKSHTYLHHHIIDGFAASHDGIKNLKRAGVIPDREYTELLEKNIERLIARIKEFRIAEKVTCIFFAALFAWLQVTNEDLDMRKGRRVRMRRRQDIESISDN